MVLDGVHAMALIHEGIFGQAFLTTRSSGIFGSISQQSRASSETNDEA
ncbi:unnamed protein product, partial [Allacma fusca]